MQPVPQVLPSHLEVRPGSNRSNDRAANETSLARLGASVADPARPTARHARRAVQWPEQPSDDTDQDPEPEMPDSRPDAEPLTPLRCRARLTDPLGPTWPDTLTEPPARTLPFRIVRT